LAVGSTDHTWPLAFSYWLTQYYAEGNRVLPKARSQSPVAGSNISERDGLSDDENQSGTQTKEVKQKQPTPPHLFLRFFRWYCHPELRDSIEGDLMEVYNERAETLGKRRADRKFVFDVLSLFRPGIIRRFEGFKNLTTSAMLKSYFIIAARNMFKQKALNVLNVVGLSVGIAAGLIIAIHIQGELSYETSFANYENIYRAHREGWATTSPVFAYEFQEYFKDVEAIGRFSPFGTRVVDTDKSNPGEAIGYYADSTIMKVFGFKVIDGDRFPLSAANTVVITRKMAKRFFGDESAIGKNVQFGNGVPSKVLKFDDGREMPVTAVIEDPPANSHIKFDFLISMPTFYQDAEEGIDGRRGWMIMYTYFSVKPGTFQRISEGMPQFIRKYYTNDPDAEQKVASRAWQIMPLRDIHLHSNLEKEMQPNSSIVYVYMFVAIELLILIVASANFMSLFTTQALRRMKEVGMRKIMGARPGQIMVQFFTEVSLLTLVSVLLAILFYGLALPFYNDLSGRSIEVWEVLRPEDLVIIGLILLTVIVVSGLYPTAFVSGFRAGSFLHENRLPRSIPNLMRSGLVVFQFVVSVSLIAATIIVGQQMDYMKNTDLGFDKEQVVNVKMYGHLREESFQNGDAFKTEFTKSPDIVAVGRVGRQIGERLSVENVVPWGKDAEQDGIRSVRVVRVDEGYLDAMNIQLVQGRNFSRAFNDSLSYIVNESAVKALRLENPIGETVVNYSRESRKGKIIGVVKDYHFATLHAEIEPLVIEFEPGWTDNLVVRISAGKTREAVEYLKRTVDKISPNSLFIYEFLDDRLDALYKSEDAMGKIFQFFSILAIIIACLGLFGLSSYTIEMRTKEIGIRKVLGATVATIVALLSSGIFRLIAIGFCLAVPLTWYVMNKWLSNFAYKIEIELWVFVLTGMTVVAIAALAVGFRTFRAAVANPVHSLRRE
jgi:putative ABC transport system permease protein